MIFFITQIITLFALTAPASATSQLDTLETKAANLQVKTLEGFLDLLPQSLRSRYVLMEKSLSLQEARPDSPRVILFSPKADLTLTFNGGEPELRGNNSLEAIEYHPETKTYEFRRFIFSTNNQPFISEKNPAICLRCHGTDSRPIWEPYNIWPGAIGAGSQLNLEDENKLRRFVLDGATHPRFSKLERQANLDQILKDKVRFTWAFNYDIALSSQRSEINLHKIRQSPNYDKFKFAILAAMAMCPDMPSFLPSSIAWASQEELNKYLYDIQENYVRLLPEHQKLMANRHNDAGKELAARLRWLFEARGISFGKWGNSFYSPYMIDAALVEQLYLIVNLSRSDPELPRIDFRDLGPIENAYAFNGNYKNSLEEPLLKLCSEIKIKSLRKF